VRGLTYYEQKGNARPGGEIGNPKWQALWRGRKGFDDQWNPRITVIKGQAGPADATRCASTACRGRPVTATPSPRLMQFWLSNDGYGKFPQTLP